MSINNSIEKLQRELSYKKMLFVDGNVQDVYFYDGRFLSLNELLTKKIKETNLFKSVFLWDRIEGLKGDIKKLVSPSAKCAPEDKQVDLGEGLLDDDNDDQSGQYKSPCDFFSVAYHNLTNSNNQNVCFIVNYANYLFNNEHGFSDDDRENLTKIMRGIREQKMKISENGSAIVFVTSNIANIPISLYQNNPDSGLITLGKPDRKEREDIVKENTTYFRLKTDLDSDEQSRTNLIDGMDNFTTKEIIQISKLSAKIDDLTVDKLLTLYKYGEKDSPWEQLDAKKVREISSILSRRVKGQEQAIKKVREVVIRAKTGLSGLQHNKSKSKPKGVLFFAGPTGVGKTELAKSLAEFLFNDESACVRFDMSEYNHEHSDQKLIGAPPGYVGYEAGGQLTNLIKERPFSVLLFDEIEKAHPKILDKFLQILEDGRLTDNKGETVYFSECIIIFTSNIGANNVNNKMEYNEIQKIIVNSIKEKFEREINRPELLGRIGYGNIVVFNYITDTSIQKEIAKCKIKPIIDYLKENKHLNVVFSNEDEFLEHVLSTSDTNKGGRDILNKLEDIFVSKLADFIFDNDGYLINDATINITLDEKKEVHCCV